MISFTLTQFNYINKINNRTVDVVREDVEVGKHNNIIQMIHEV